MKLKAAAGTRPPLVSNAGERWRVVSVELLAIDLCSCARCVPAAGSVRRAVELLEPVARELRIDLRHSERVIADAAEARSVGLVSSPTIRLNGHDIAGELRESECASCGGIDCRDWPYRGESYPEPPLPFLLETIMQAMLEPDSWPVTAPERLSELPENLQRFFDSKSGAGSPANPCGQ